MKVVGDGAIWIETFLSFLKLLDITLTFLELQA